MGQVFLSLSPTQDTKTEPPIPDFGIVQPGMSWRENQEIGTLCFFLVLPLKLLNFFFYELVPQQVCVCVRVVV